MNEVLYENAEKRQARLKKKTMKAYRKLKRKQYKTDMKAVVAAVNASNEVKSKHQPSVERARKKFEKYGKKSGIVKAAVDGSYMVDKDIDKEMQDIDAVENLKAGLSTGFYKKPKKKKTKVTNESLNNLNEARKGVAHPESLDSEAEDNFGSYHTKNGKPMSYAEFDNRRDAYTSGHEAAKEKDPEKRKELIKKGKQSKLLAKMYAAQENGEHTERSKDYHLKYLETAGKTELYKKYAEKYNRDPETGLRVALADSYTEYELMQILDENGFTTTDEDVALLREAIETGKVLLETRVTE